MAARFEYRQAEEIAGVFRKHAVRYLFIGKSGAIILGYPDTIYEVGPRIKDDLRLPVPFRSAPEWLASARATEGRSSPAR